MRLIDAIADQSRPVTSGRIDADFGEVSWTPTRIEVEIDAWGSFELTEGRAGSVQLSRTTVEKPGLFRDASRDAAIMELRGPGGARCRLAAVPVDEEDALEGLPEIEADVPIVDYDELVGLGRAARFIGTRIAQLPAADDDRRSHIVPDDAPPGDGTVNPRSIVSIAIALVVVVAAAVMAVLMFVASEDSAETSAATTCVGWPTTSVDAFHAAQTEAGRWVVVALAETEGDEDECFIARTYDLETGEKLGAGRLAGPEFIVSRVDVLGVSRGAIWIVRDDGTLAAHHVPSGEATLTQQSLEARHPEMASQFFSRWEESRLETWPDIPWALVATRDGNRWQVDPRDGSAVPFEGPQPESDPCSGLIELSRRSGGLALSGPDAPTFFEPRWIHADAECVDRDLMPFLDLLIDQEHLDDDTARARLTRMKHRTDVVRTITLPIRRRDIRFRGALDGDLILGGAWSDARLLRIDPETLEIVYDVPLTSH